MMFEEDPLWLLPKARALAPPVIPGGKEKCQSVALEDGRGRDGDRLLP